MVTTRTRQFARPTLAALAGLGLIGVLAACAPAEAEEQTPDGGDSGSQDSSATTAPETDTETDAEDSASTYADGTYEAEGSYRSPGGNETVQVSITLEDDVVTAVTVTPTATSGNSKQYQTAFAGGIADVVVGKDIDELDVSKVSGSSLTSGGFNEAVETIKADAAG
ncbi:FMN-binding protein [Herbiconiux sp. L3-i23]|uniref:FMN-binding protein n=1 Tax=Herbiconiux sp. L3-i23 TaxID=2905871 RepID=UPI0020570C2C|nr:FMN-binding protein [Herbiconiux sp. L3-i23]BDI23307.1 hypothetical protein L3i23_20830 [Herbiconiux sp. L3-i23]